MAVDTPWIVRQPPDTYAEFLLRSRVTSRHEPTAHRRAAGREVK